MNDRTKVLLVLLVLPLFLGMAAGEEEEHSPSPSGFIGKVFNFLVLFGGLYILLRKPLGAYLEQRARDIDSAIGEAKKDREDMEALLNQSSERLSKLDEEIERMRTEAREEADRKKEQIQKAAERESEKIREWNSQEIDMLYRLKIKELKTKAAELATALAERSLEDKMTPEKHSLFVDSSIKKIEKFYEK
jgi:F-type H+-transporting ATPase subunit b